MGSAGRAGQGVAVVSERAIRESAARGEVRVLRLADVALERPFYLVHDLRRKLSPVAAAFAAHLRREASEGDALTLSPARTKERT